MKLTMLKTVPKINPLPMGFSPARIKKRPIKMADAMAREQYFFCICLSISIWGIYAVIIVSGNFKDLTIDNVCATDDTQYDKNGNENAFCSQPFV
jgi:hypothetical protein